MKRFIRRIRLGPLLNSLFASAEDPRETFTSTGQRGAQLLSSVITARERISHTQSRLEGQLAVFRRDLRHFEEDARKLVRNNRGDAARLILVRRQAAIDRIRSLDEQIRVLDTDARSLDMFIDKLSSQIDAYLAQQDIAAARYSAAQARARVSEALGAVSDEFSDVIAALEQAEERAEHMQARADALEELASTDVIQVSGISASSLPDVTAFSNGSEKAVEEMLLRIQEEESASR